MNIEQASKSDIPYLATIHLLFIPSGFLSRLGEKFLCLIYEALHTSQYGILVVARDGSRVIGFVSGVVSVKKFYLDFIRRYFFRALNMLILKAGNLLVLKKMIETFLYPTKKIIYPEGTISSAELLSIVLDADYRGREVAQFLFEKLKVEFSKKEIYSFKIIVGSHLDRAIRFYEKMGCKRVGEIVVHKGEISYVFIYEITKGDALSCS